MSAISARRSPVRLFPPVGLSLLFRPLPKGGQRPTLKVSYQIGPGHLLRFSAREALGVPEQTLLLAVMELAGEQYVEQGEGATLSRDDTRPMPSRLWDGLYPDGGVGLPGTLMLDTTWEELNRRCGSGNGGSMIATRRTSLRRLCEVVVWEERAELSRIRQAFLMVWLEGNDRRVHLAVNHLLASSFLGGQYARLWMGERLKLSSDLAMHVHAFLSTWVRQGQRYQVGLSTLVARVWPTCHDTAPAGTQRRRRLELMAAVKAIGRLEHWTLEWSSDREVFSVHRLAVAGVREMTHTQPKGLVAPYRERVVGENLNKNKALSPYDVSALFK